VGDNLSVPDQIQRPEFMRDKISDEKVISVLMARNNLHVKYSLSALFIVVECTPSLTGEDVVTLSIDCVGINSVEG